MDGKQQAAKRVNAKRESIGVIDKLVDQVTGPGFYGKIRLALEVQDGVVQLVRNEGVEQTFAIGRQAA